MQPRQRDLGGAGEEQLVLGDLVDLVAVAGQEPGPLQRLLADQHRRHHRLVALGRGRARSRSGPGPARAAPGRPSGRRSASRRGGRPASMSISPSAVPMLEVVARLEVELGPLADLAQHHRVLLAHPVRRVGVGQVRQRQRRAGRARPRPPPAPPCRTRSSPSGPATAAISLLGVAARLLGLADLLGERLALGLGVLDLGQQLAPAGVEREQLVDLARPRRAAPAPS